MSSTLSVKAQGLPKEFLWAGVPGTPGLQVAAERVFKENLTH